MLKLQAIGIAAAQVLWLIAPPVLAQENQVELDSQCLSDRAESSEPIAGGAKSERSDENSRSI